MHLEKEKCSSRTLTPEIYPWRWVANFVGLGSSGSLPPHTSWSALNRIESQENHKASKLTTDQCSAASSSLRTGPRSSGEDAPVTIVSPHDLQLVRDQMVVALEKLKQMEEQVKIIPVLQVKISILKEEKKQLNALVKNLENTWKYFKPEKTDESKRASGKKVDGWEYNAVSDLEQSKQLHVKMQLNANDDKNMDMECVYSKGSVDGSREATLGVRSVEVGVNKVLPSVVSNTKLELEIQQQSIEALSNKVQTLEEELKAELSHHGARYDSTQPEAQSIRTQTGILKRTIDVGKKDQPEHAAVGKDAVQTFNSVGVTCHPETCDVASGLDIPIEMWEIQKKVEKKDQCVGTQYVPPCSQGVGTCVTACDAGITTLDLIKTLEKKKTTKIQSISAGTPVHPKEGTVTSGTSKVMTRDVGVGLANINENFLVGLRTRNMACGPSRLPDPHKTRSIGVEVGDGRIRDMDGHMWMPVQLAQPHSYAQMDPGLDQYMQRLAKEQQILLTGSHIKPKVEVAVQSQHPMDPQQGDDSHSRSIIIRKDMSQKCAECKKTCMSPSPRCEISDTVIAACHTLKAHLNDSKVLSSRELHSCLSVIQQDWFCVSSQKKAYPETVEAFLTMCHHASPAVLTHVANMADQNGNTALHYSVSHSNFMVVQKLLDAGICNANHQNKAGYTPIMLAVLAAVETNEDISVVESLFRRGDINTKAIQTGQTALMLAVSHGRMDMVRTLLASGSEVNIQDNKGSTALMCASEHGYADIVRLLLAHPGCDATLRDSDDSTAMSIALDAGHSDIVMLLHAYQN